MPLLADLLAVNALLSVNERHNFYSSCSLVANGGFVSRGNATQLATPLKTKANFYFRLVRATDLLHCEWQFLCRVHQTLWWVQLILNRLFRYNTRMARSVANRETGNLKANWTTLLLPPWLDYKRHSKHRWSESFEKELGTSFNKGTSWRAPKMYLLFQYCPDCWSNDVNRSKSFTVSTAEIVFGEFQVFSYQTATTLFLYLNSAISRRLKLNKLSQPG